MLWIDMYMSVFYMPSFKKIELPFYYIKGMDPNSHIINFYINNRWISDLL